MDVTILDEEMMYDTGIADTLSKTTIADDNGEVLEVNEKNGNIGDDYSDDDNDNDDESIIPAEIPTPEIMIELPVSPVEMARNIHPVQRMQHRACILSGVSMKKAFAIDDLRLGIKLVCSFVFNISLLIQLLSYLFVVVVVVVLN